MGAGAACHALSGARSGPLYFAARLSESQQKSAAVAQLVEQRIRNAKVGGSTPLSGTNSFASSTIVLGVSMFNHKLLTAITAALFSCAAFAQDKVVYHFGEGLAQATNGLRNIRNHLEVDPKAKIIVVAHAQGVDFLMNGAQDANKNPYNVIVEDLKSQGVTFEICQITLRNRKLEQKQFIPEVTYTPSGVQRIT